MSYTAIPNSDIDADSPITVALLTAIRDNADFLLNLEPAGAVKFFAGLYENVPAGYLPCDGAAVSRTTYATLFAALVASATVTITIASPAVVTWTGHGRVANEPVEFATTDTFPTGIVAGTTYYVKTVTTDTFQISAHARRRLDQHIGKPGRRPIPAFTRRTATATDRRRSTCRTSAASHRWA